MYLFFGCAVYFVVVVVPNVWYTLFVISLEPFDCFEESVWIVMVFWMLKVYGIYYLVPVVCLLLAVLVSNFVTDFFDNISVVLCGAVLFDVVVG